MEKIKSLKNLENQISWEVSLVGKHFHVTGTHRTLGVGGSGFASSEDTARKIAFSEINERYIVAQLSDSIFKDQWKLDSDDSCSGFAVGHSRAKTIVRSLYEASERWALAQWIDHDRALSPVASTNPSDVQTATGKLFEKSSILGTHVNVLLEQTLVKVHVAVVLGWTKNGVFAGYGARSNINDAIDHAFVESMRNLLIYQNQPPRVQFPYNRIGYFANERHLAELIISKSRNKDQWPTPQLNFVKAEQVDSFWICRSILGDWMPWQNGPIERFLY